MADHELTPAEVSENIRDLQSSMQTVFYRLRALEAKPRKPIPWWARAAVAILCMPAIGYAASRDWLWPATFLIVYMFGAAMSAARAHQEQL